MAADHLEFHKNKFINDFQEVVEEFEELPLRLHFQNILKVLQEKTISPSTPIVLKNPLYQVRSALTECVMFAEKERERKAQNKKSRYNVHHMRKLWFLRKTGKKLVRIEAKLRETRDNAAVESSPLDLSLITVSERQSSNEPIFRPTIYGFDDQLQKIEKLLLKTSEANSINTVGIVGMGGVGKTALANEMDHASNSSNLSHGLPKGSGGAIIVTSRLKKVAHGMVGEHNLVQLYPTLDEESCWSIFMDSVGRKSRMFTENIGAMKRMKEEIVDNCGGLPLAAMTLAEVISIQMSNEQRFWPDPSAYKWIELGLHVYDDDDFEKAIRKLRLIPGVADVKINTMPINPVYKSYILAINLICDLLKPSMHSSTSIARTLQNLQIFGTGILRQKIHEGTIRGMVGGTIVAEA
ncbi:hypothetical protein F0562_006930 [Nyssa sinensis]|uniref:NB-ARC domain-containing protein n=1 Tax=Nyssa sinensis TaxID=561372 RepID=A0A5J5A598_9ASTE|nr:hypothetical protein F0562_006930 [Nyssa sinensis]